VARVQTFSNGIDTQTWGIDLTAKYQATIGESGRLLLTGAFNQTQSQVNSDVRTPQRLSEEFDASIFGRESRLELTQERPDNRLNLNATYEQGNFSATLGSRRYGETLSPDDTPEDDFTISSEWIFDLSMSYSFFNDHAEITVGSRNLTDRYPDADPLFFGMLPFPTASPFGFNGREVYSSLSVSL
jgi:iron complex outermembrane receptor protein